MKLLSQIAGPPCKSQYLARDIPELSLPPPPKEKKEYSRTSLIQTPKGQSKVSVLERCPFYRGHYDDGAFKLPLTVCKCLVTKNRHTHASSYMRMKQTTTHYATPEKVHCTTVHFGKCLLMPVYTCLQLIESAIATVFSLVTLTFGK